MKIKFADVIALGVLSMSIAMTALRYAQLPALIPIHFDVYGKANGWAPRAIGAWLLPAVTLGSWILVRHGAKVLPHHWRMRMQASPVAAVAALIAMLLSALQLLVLYTSSHPVQFPISTHWVIFGVFWITLGLMLPRVRRNPWIGVRTPWTLSSDENWAKTHRFAGYAFVLSGILALLATALHLPFVPILLIVASAAASMLYSFVQAHKSRA
jgi:uncharacterized membrane protein